MRTPLFVFVFSLIFTSCQKEIEWEKPKLTVEKMVLTIGDQTVGTGEWIIKDGTTFQGVQSPNAFLGDGYIQFKIVADGTKTLYYNSALGYTTDTHWTLQHDPFNSRLVFREDRQDVGELKDYSFAYDYFRWYREDSTVTLRHSSAEDGTYSIIYKSPKNVDPQEPIYFGGGTTGPGNGLTEVKIAGEKLIRL